jgi:hypothetical protein
LGPAAVWIGNRFQLGLENSLESRARALFPVRIGVVSGGSRCVRIAAAVGANGPPSGDNPRASMRRRKSL